MGEHKDDVTKTQSNSDFAKQAQSKRFNFLPFEVFKWIYSSRKYWLMPIVFILLIVTVLVILQSQVVAPLIYALF